MTSLAAKLPTQLWGTDANVTPEQFHANYVRMGGHGFLYNVRRITVKEAYAMSPRTYDMVVRKSNVPPGTAFYWFACEVSEVPL